MPGDYTRFTFDPFANHLGVLMQQGRVTLDADWNELVEILDRHLRVRTLDTIGRAVVPLETPDGFRIQPAGASFTIGRGRSYVHGLLAENHGAGDLEWDRVLAEERRTEPTPYEEQPYLPDPPPLPVDDAGGPGTYLVYLDVWERELTHVEDPDLVEKAVGVDTAARLQTVWQVRHLPVPRGTTCATPDDELPGWLEVTLPSGGRLTTRAVGVPASDDPCILDPAGGYRGIENRLYRVEVHDPGDLDTATFKWSRDNGSIATRVRAIDAGLDTLTVVRIGRDGVRRLAPQDWVEVLDDRLELHGEPGVMRKIESVDEVNETITLEEPLPAGVFDAADPQRLDTRVRRWDQKGQVLDAANAEVADVDDSDGVIPVGAGGGTMVLEDGVEVSFSLADSDELDAFRTGDAWVFAARTVDASVEELVEAPPRAIHHHYSRLAVLDGGQVIDCRIFWPPEFGGDEGCDCTECVSADEHNSGVFTIQMALDRVRAEGGKVCLGPGTFNLGDQPVAIHGMSSVQLLGHGFATLLLYTGSGPAVTVSGASGIALERFAVAAFFGQERTAFALGLAGSAFVTVRECGFLQLGGPDRGGPAVALSGALVQTSLRDNLIFGREGIRAVYADAGAEGPLPGARSVLATFGLTITGNLVFGTRHAIDLGLPSLHLGETRIDDNQLAGGSEGALRIEGFAPAREYPSHVDLRGNVVTTTGDGIVVGTHQARLRDNDVGVLGPRERDPEVERHGILLVPGLAQMPIEGCQILANRVTGLSGDGIRIAAPVGSAMIKQNVLRDLAGGIVMADGSEAVSLTIENNQLFEIEPGGVRGSLVASIRAWRVEQLEIASNTVLGFAETSLQTQIRATVEIGACRSARVSGNDLRRIGPVESAAGTSVGIVGFAPFESIGIQDNEVERGHPIDVREGVRWIGIAIVGPLDQATVGRRAVAGPVDRSRTVRLDENRIAVIDDRAIIVLPQGARSIGLRGNHVSGAGEESLVVVVRGASATLTDNRVEAAAAPESARPTVDVDATSIIAASNAVTRRPSNEGREAIRLSADVEQGATVLGNIADGGTITLGGQELQDPWRPLNVIRF